MSTDDLSKSPSHQPLFRREALNHKRETWLGEILLVRPTSFAVLTGFFLLIALSILAYLVWGEYTKKARVTGYVVPDQGVIKVFAPQPGTVTELRATEGQVVKRGDVLLILSVEKTNGQGSTQTEIRKHLDARRSSLEQEAKNVSMIEILDRATPAEHKSWPPRTTFCLVAFFAGGVLGIAYTAIERIVRTIARNPRNRERYQQLTQKSRA